MTLLLISFVAGVLTILAPCILPLLPVIVGHSISDSTLSKRRLLVVVLSLGASVVLFTILLKATTLFINIPQDFWKWISGGIIFLFGLTMVFPKLWESLAFTSIISRKSNVVLTKGFNKDSVWGDIIIGASLGPIFSACSPTYFVILATVLPATPILGLIYLFTYVFGLCLALVIVALVGQKIMVRLGSVSDPRGWFKRILGMIFILVALAIISGYDKKIQIRLLDSGFLDVTKIEQKLLDIDTQEKMKNEKLLGNSLIKTEKDETAVNDEKLSKDINKNFLSLAQKKDKFTLAPDLSSIDGFINTDGKPVTISEFKGKKVVLLDIWTYSCINCQRTIPYLNEWYKKYEDEGLVIIGLHTPEFAFERVLKNVEEGVKRFGIKYPVVLDNDFSTWIAYENQYWPRKYLIDIDGYIVYDHAGEGEYDATERAIQKALNERNSRLDKEATISSGIVNPIDKIIVEANKVSSPEIYFGSSRNSRLSNGKIGVANTQTLNIPIDIESNNLYLGGTWSFSPEYSQNNGGGNIVFKYNAKNVYMVASSAEGSDIEIYVDGKLIDTVFIKDETLYPIVKGIDYQEHTLEIKIKGNGIKAFTFTFG